MVNSILCFLLYFIPVGKTMVYMPDYHGNGDNITNDDWKLLAGIFIVMNIIWFIIGIITLILYLIEKRKYKNIKSYYKPSFESPILFIIINIGMFALWAFVLLGYLGYQISKLL